MNFPLEGSNLSISILRILTNSSVLSMAFTFEKPTLKIKIEVTYENKKDKMALGATRKYKKGSRCPVFTAESRHVLPTYNLHGNTFNINDSNAK